MNKFIVDIEQDGIYCDFINNKLVIVIKDKWSVSEKKLMSNKAKLSFVSKFDLNIFVFSINDCIDCSDVIFDLNNENSSILICENLDVEIFILDQQNIIIHKRQGTFDKDSTKLIVDIIKNNPQNLSDEDYLLNTSLLYKMYEPFELDDIALTSTNL